MDGSSKTPKNWVETTIGELYEFEYGKGLTKKNRVESGDYPVYGSNGVVGAHDEYLVKGPVLIVGRKGAAGAVSFSPNSCWPIDTTYFIRENQNLDIKFSYYLLKSLNLAKYEKSTAIPGLNRNDAYEEKVLLPPLNEQRRIVAKIEALFSELEAGTAALQTAAAQLKSYRQSLLKHAFEGKLTAEWRAENQDKLETAETLLQRIKEERQARYEAAVAEWEAKGRNGRKPQPPKEAPPLTERETAEMPELPPTWFWVRLVEISDLITDGTHHTPTYVTNGVPFISVKDVYNERVNFEECKFIPLEEHVELIKRCNPESGDLLVTKSGTIGRLALVPDKEFSLFVSVALIKIQSIKHLVNPHWLLYAFEYHLLTLNIDQDIKGGLLKNYHLEDLRLAKLPLIPLNEQNQIVSEIEAKLSILESLEKTISDSLQQAEALRQSILKKAFAGQLVPQDPNDEPAAALLARIQAGTAGAKN